MTGVTVSLMTTGGRPPAQCDSKIRNWNPNQLATMSIGSRYHASLVYAHSYIQADASGLIKIILHAFADPSMDSRSVQVSYFFSFRADSSNSAEQGCITYLPSPDHTEHDHHETGAIYAYAHPLTST